MSIKSAHWSFTDNGDGTTDHFLLAPEGTRSNVPVVQTDTNGNTVLVGADGIPKDRFPRPLNPNGLSWLTDTLHGFDIYERGFVKTPTLYFDPSATSSMNRGTFAHPYNTQAALQAVIKGNMAGHVLGFKRGTTLRTTGSGLVLNVTGSSADRFSIVPYGDAEALPIITGGSVINTWTLVDVASNVWKYTIGATQPDVFQNDVRVWSLDPTNATTNNDTGTTVSNDATAITALSAKGAGWSCYVGTTMYFKPYAGENPNLGQVEVNLVTDGFKIVPADVLNSGYLEICGLDVRKGRNHGLEVAAAAASSTMATLADVAIVGCRVSGAGYDNQASTLSGAGVSITGLSDTVRMSDLYVAGNYSTGSLNNAYEFEGVTGGIVEHNIGYDVGGYSIAELYASCDSFDIRYNYGEKSTFYGRRLQSYGAAGVWFGNKYSAAPGDWDTNDASNTKNFGNVAHHNLIVMPQNRGLMATGGTGHKFQHNTVIADGDALYGENVSAGPVAGSEAMLWQTDGTAATGFCDISNNLYYQPNQSVNRSSSLFMRINATLGAAASVPSGNNNVYFRVRSNSGGFYYSGAGQTNFTTYKTALSAYALDQNSFCGHINTGANLTVAQLGMDEATWTPLAATIQGLTTLTGIGTRYKDGQPYVAASATIGAMKGS